MKKALMTGISALALSACGLHNGYEFDQTLQEPNQENRMTYVKHALLHHPGSGTDMSQRWSPGINFEREGLSYILTLSDYNGDGVKDLLLDQGMVDPQCQVDMKGCTYFHAADSYGMRRTGQVVDWGADGTIDEFVGMSQEEANDLYQSTLDALAVMNYEGRTKL